MTTTVFADASIVASDLGKPIGGVNIPGGTIINSVNPGVGGTLSNNATGGPSGPYAVGFNVRLDTISGLSNNLNTFTDSSLQAGDIGTIIYGANIPPGTIITNVSGTTGTLSNNATGAASGTYLVGGTCLNTAYDAGIKSIIAALGPGTASAVTFVEGHNEPNEAGYSDLSYASLYTDIRNTIRAQLTTEGYSPSAISVMGPGYNSSAPTGSDGNLGPYLSNVANFIAQVQALGGNLDALSLHDYNGFTGDFFVTDGWIGGARTTLSTYGIPNIPIWITEMGNIIKDFWIGGQFGCITERRLITWTAQTYLTLERHGVPREQVLYYYDTNIGEVPWQGGVFTWLKSSDGSLGPQATFFRVYAEELWGKNWIRSLTFNTGSGFTNGDNYFRGEVFSEGSSGSGTGVCVALYAPGIRSDAAVLGGCGSNPITYSDWQGNVTTVVPVNGNITVPILDTPTYIRLPLSCAATAYVVSIVSGINATPISGVTSSAGGNPASLSTVSEISDGVFRTGGYLAGPDYMYQSTTLPHYVELQFPSQQINQVVIRQAPPYAYSLNNPGCAMLTGQLQYLVGSTWTNAPTVTDSHWSSTGAYNNPTQSTQILSTVGHDWTAGAMIRHDWDEEWVISVALAPITTTAVRLVINSTSVGNFITNAGYPQTVNVSQMQVFNVTRSVPNSGPPEIFTGSATVDMSSTITLAVNPVDGFGNPEAGETIVSSTCTVSPSSIATPIQVNATDWMFTPLSTGVATVTITATGSLGHVVKSIGTLTVVASPSTMTSALDTWSITSSS